MGERTKQAWRRCNRERDRATVRRYKERHREELRAYDRRYGDENRAACPHCGCEYGKWSGRVDGSAAPRLDFTNCPGCAAERRDWIVGMWDQGASMDEICEPLGWTKNHLSKEMDRMRRDGYSLPYRRKLRNPAYPEQVAA